MYSYIPLTCLSILNILIILAMRKASNERKRTSPAGTSSNVSSNTTKPNSSTAKKSSQIACTETQITIMLLSVTMGFLALTSPMASLLIVERIWEYGLTKYDSATWRLLRAVTANLMFTNHAMNIVLYTVAASQFRRQLKSLCVDHLPWVKPRLEGN